LSIAGLAARGVKRRIGASFERAVPPGNRLMTLWFVFALMTVAAIFAVLWPLSRGAASKPGGSEAVVYTDQLAEIDRDVAAGLIGGSEAEAARVEIGRRLLAAVDGERDLSAQSNPKLRRSSAILALVGLPVAAVTLYLALGSPQLGDFPLSSRTRTVDANQPLENLVAQVESHLEKNPTDGRGWNVLAPVLARLGRYDDAVRAYRNSITHSGDSAERRSDLGEALVGSAGGVVTSDAKAEFERAMAQSADDPKANYFLGLAAEQDGRNPDAASIWRAMLAKAPPNAPWRPLVEAALVRVGEPSAPTAPALSNEAM
jgi:cytochrome c-type biogenesis protein CcmH